MYLAIQNTYDQLQLALFTNGSLLGRQFIDKTHASKLCIDALQELLVAHSYDSADIQFIAVNKGPAPFTTLRVAIATVNGLSFATKKPLIGIDAFDLYLREHTSKNVLIVLFNAFGNDVYYAINNSGSVEKGMNNIDILLATIKERFSDQRITFMGNGTELYFEKIKPAFGHNTHIPSNNPLYCSIESLGIAAYEQWQHSPDGQTQIMPIYLKKIF